MQQQLENGKLFNVYLISALEKEQVIAIRPTATR